MMSNLKSELMISDHDDHSQPINLAAPRAPAPPVSFTTNPGLTSASTQPVTLRGHAESQKPGLMLQALYIRAPSASSRPPGPSHVMTPIMGGQVGTTQHFNAKSVFKSVKGVKVNYYSDKPGDKTGVIRMPSADSNQLQNNSTQSGSFVSNILPNALAGNPTRHMVSSPLHPVISGGAGNSGSMASIIKGAHQVSQVGHVIHPPYSSHVPRGPAAVASITSAPKSAVATPILRAPHSSSAMTLASSVIAPHAAASFRTRSPTLVTGRTATPPVVSSISHQQVIDLQKNTVNHSLQTQSQACLVSRSIDMSTSSMRPGISHPSVGSHNKPMNSQPIVQHLQQVGKHVSEKSYLKTVSSASNAQSNSTPAHQNASHLTSNHSTTSDVHGVVPTITRATLSNISGSGGYPTGFVQPSAGSVPTLRPSLVQPHPLHALSSSVPSVPHQTLTVISTKSLQSTSSPVTVSSQLNRTITVCSTGVASSGTIVTTSSVLPSTHSRLLSAPTSINQGAVIPVAKVYPQSVPVQLKADHMDLDHNRSTTLVTAGSTVSSVMTTANTTSQTVVVTEKRSDSTAPVRVTSLGKHITSNTAYSSGPPATYLYDQYHGTTLAVHPYSMPSSNQNFSTTPLSGSQLRPLALSQHGNANMGSGLHPSVTASGNSGSVQPLNSLMVAVDSRHITLHSPYNASSTSKPNSEMTSHQTTMITNASASLVVTSQASSGQNSSTGSQGNASNHLSPRPSILRKRTIEGISGVTKRNLISKLCATINSLPSPKRTSEPVQENGITTLASEPDSGRLLMTSPIIKKESGTDSKSVSRNLFSFNKECPIETSPRKKPRKQLLSANELIETHSPDTEENFTHESHLPEVKTEESENVKWVTFSKRPSMSLMSNYKHSWKSRHNHFHKYNDVKHKEEKRTSVHELANQKCVLQDVNAWKIHHLTGQMEILNNAEDASISRMSHWLDLEEKGSWISNKTLSNEDYKILTKLTDIVKGNLQRSKIAQEQAMESKQQVLKIVDHKPNLVEIVNKYISRRPLKKKEKT